MDEVPGYKEEVESVDALDSAYTPSTATVEVDAVLENRLQIRRPSYAEVMARVEKIEGRRTEPEQAAQPRPQPQPQPQMQPQIQELNAQKQGLATAKSSAAEKLKSMVGKGDREMQESVSPVSKAEASKNPVLPQLSLQDQLTDLEKIEEGIGEKAFSGEQLEVIRQEIRALSAGASHADLKKMSAEQQQVAMLVDRRVKEIKAELNM